MIRKNKKRNYLMIFLIFINIITFSFSSNPAFALDLDGLDATASEISMETDTLGTTGSEVSAEPNTSDTTDSEVSVEPDALDITTDGDSMESDTSTTTPPAVEVEVPVAELDSEAPIITLIGDAEENVALWSDYTDSGVTITDNQDTGLVATVTYTKDGNLIDYINTFEEGTYIVHYNVSDTAMNPAVEVTRTVQVGSMEEDLIPNNYNVEGYEIDLSFSLLSDEEIKALLEVPDGAEDDDPEVTTPAAVSVKINGTEKVGNTLSGELIMEDGNLVTTSSAVTYEWYRLPSEDSEDSTLVGDNKTYKLVSSDGSKYIKLIVSYEGETFEAITSKIAKKSSSSSSSSSSNNNLTESSSTTPDDQTDVTDSNSGVSAEGWKEKLSDWKYIKNGQAVTGWNQIDDSWYLMDSTGTMQKGWQQTNGDWYLLKSNGSMATGWQQINDIWYLLKNDGSMAIGWQQIDGIWYLLKSDGSMAIGWQQTNSIWYFLKNDGAMATGWQQIDGTWYLLNSDGAMATDL